SFDLEALEGAGAVLTGNGSSATATVTKPGKDYQVKLYAKTGVELTAGETYTISMNVANAEGSQVCYKRYGGEETDFGTETVSGGKAVHTVKPEQDGTLEILLKLGNVPENTAVTVSGISIAKSEGATMSENLMTDSLCVWAPVHVWMDGGYVSDLTNDDSSATLKMNDVAAEQADWKVKLFVETGAELKAGKQYRISYKLNADKETAYHAFYNNGAEEKGVGEFYNLKTGTDKVEHTVTPGKDAVLNIQLMLGNSPASNNITISDVNVEEIVSGSTNPPINSWTHEDYVTSLTNTDSSATMNIEKVPASGRESWKIKLFAETHQKLEAGKTYRVSVDVQSASSMGYEICYNNASAESELGTKPGLNASSTKQTVTYNVSPSKEAELTLQFNLGNAAAANSFTISNIKIEDAKEVSSKNLIPNFRYNAVGYLNGMADEGYVTSFRRDDSSATFKIKKAPDERNPWNAKVTARTGFTPEAGKGYRVSVDVTSNVEQKLFEIFYDGDKELDYGALYEQKLPAGTKTFSYIIYPGDSKGELVLQLRFGKTDDNSGNKYVINNIKVEEVTFTSSSSKEIKNTAELVTQSGYNAELIKSADRASVRLLKTPKNGREAWKNKLFVYPGVKLEEGQKYRITAVVKSIIPAPFEICLNDGDVEKGLGGIFGLMSRPQGAYITYASYVPKDIQLAVQLSLGNCVAPNTITLSDVKVEKAGKINQVSDKIYIFR
ncbi:MAG: hypothetical protein II153_07060, partial [Erysipelotrichaceae bacterium]|nr:hypothetical protein [Erysipelotrichaceae bacterium]